MKNGQLKVWWISNGQMKINKEVETLLDGMWIIHTQSILEVNDNSIDFNVGGVSYFDEEYLKPEYCSEDGFMDFMTEYGEELDDIMNEIIEINKDKPWTQITKEEIKTYLVQNNIKGESKHIKIV